MKAFQLKIVIKDSKPPIWRRVIVPAGITFSQLAVILNKVMGWAGYHLSEFEFYHLELRLAEMIDDFEIGYGPFDYMEASTTYIREYLEENDWFTYTYDFGDNWKHRVTIEKVLDDYALDYPQVIKFKGNCPMEDCGGIHGYYEMLDIINDPLNPDYEEHITWMKSFGYPNEYDIEAVNNELKEQCYYIWGKGDKRLIQNIYEDLFEGKFGLCATKRDKNRNNKVIKSNKHQLDEKMNAFIKQMNEMYKAQNEYANVLSLASIFEDFNKEDIYEIASGKGLKVSLRSSKSDLIKKLVSHMLNPITMKSYFGCLQDDQINEFEKVLQSNGLYISNKKELLHDLCISAYVGITSDGRYMLSEDVRLLYQSFADHEFHKKRYISSTILGCLRISSLLHGIAPLSIILKMVNQFPGIDLTLENLKVYINDIPNEFRVYVVVVDKLYNNELYPSDRGLTTVQGNKPYYIPSIDEIKEVSIYGYFCKQKETQRFIQFLMQKMGAIEEHAMKAGKIVQLKLCGDFSLADIMDMLDAYGFTASSKKDLEEMVDLIVAMRDNTRMLVNRGYTLNELSFNSKRVKSKAASNTSKIINFNEARKGKIYPNAPCPCGSGKKFKNCCKNKI